MNVRKLNDDDLANYDELVNGSTEGTVFHKSWWLKMFENYYGSSYKIDFYGAFENDELISGLPIPLHNKLGIRFIYHPKLTPYLGSFHNHGKGKMYGEITRKKKVDEEFAGVLSRLKNCIYYSFHYNNIDMQPFKWKGFDVGVQYTYTLNLDNLDRIWNNMDKTRRHDINKCCKQDYNIKLNKIEDFIELNKKSMERQGHKILSEKLWQTVFNGCKQHKCCEVFTAYQDNVAKASLLLVWDNKCGYYLAGGINNNSEGVMSLLMWEAIKYTKEKLYLNGFDFEGSNIRGIEFYFRKFGGSIRPIFYIGENSIKRALIMRFFSNI